MRRWRTGAKAALLVLAILLAVVAFVPSLLGAYRHEFQVTNEQITEALDSRFPVRKVYLSVFHMTYENPRVVLTEGSDRVACGLDALLVIPSLNLPEPLTGSADVTCGVDYDPDNGKLYLTDARLVALNIQGIPFGYQGLVQKVSNKLIGELLGNLPVYTLKPGSAKMSLARLILRKATVKNGVLVVTLGI